MKKYSLIRTIDVMDPKTKKLTTLKIVRDNSTGEIVGLKDVHDLDISECVKDYWKDRSDVALMEDWFVDVANQDTLLGYHEWADKRIAQEALE